MTKLLEIALTNDEYWWGGRVADGKSMPYSLKTEGPIRIDLSVELAENQGNPLLVSSKGRYVWSDQPFAIRIDQGVLNVESRGGELLLAEGFKNVRGAFLEASRRHFPTAGEVPEPLLFTAPQYNLWIELMYEPTQEKVLQYARDVLKAGMPPGVIMIDDNWHEPYGTWQYHSGRFPNPKEMAEELHRMGFKLMLWVCPFVSPDSKIFRELETRGLLLKDKEGRTAIRQWWNGHSAVLDLSNEETVQWFQSQLDILQTDYGVDGFKFDAGDLPFYRANDQSATPYTPNDHCEAWGRVGLNFPLNEYRACWKLAGQPLVQRLKDKNHAWDGNGLASLIPDGLSQGLLGYAFTCPDMIGGGSFTDFIGDVSRLDAELIVRYAQCSALFPMMQFSAAPWRVLDEEHNRYCVEAANLHSELGPEILELAKQSAESGEPITRPMAYEFPEEGLEEVKDQFMLGPDILVAPVVTKGTRSRLIKFPAGIWTGDDGSIVHGPAAMEINVPLNRLPWFRRG